MRKSILFHAFVILTVAFALSLVTGIAQAMDHPSTKAWLVSHVTSILVCLLISVVGLLWDDLRLGRKSSRALYLSTVPANYVVMLILGVLAPALGASPGIVVPEAPPPTGGLAALVASGIIIATITRFAMSILVVAGLRDHKGRLSRSQSPATGRWSCPARCRASWCSCGTGPPDRAAKRSRP